MAENRELIMPKHVAIILDGNGRWAEQRGLKRSDGHKAGSEALKKVVEYALPDGLCVQHRKLESAQR